MSTRTRGAPERNGNATRPVEVPPEGAAWAAPPSSGRRSVRSRAPVGVLAAVVAAILAFVLVVAAGADRSAKVQVAVATRDIPAGGPVTGADVRWVDLPARSELAGTLVGPGDLEGGRRWVAASRVAAGAPIGRPVLVESAAPGGRRAMSIPVPPERAAGGEFRAGDRVDVIEVTGTDAAYVVVNAEVLREPSRTEAGIGSAQADFFLVVAVDGAEALRLAAALGDGKVDVARSTGATPLPKGAAGAG